MRIIFLNIWHGTIWQDLKQFIQEHSKNTDIFCFLEVDPDVEKKLEKILLDYQPIYSKGIKTEYLNGVVEGRTVFVKKGIKIKNSQKIDLYKNTPIDAGGMLFVELMFRDKTVFLGEVHGKAKPGTKVDTKERLKQSEIIIESFKNKNGLKIIGGDLNLNPDTQSIYMFEKAGYRNLIKEFDIKSTRNEISWTNLSKDPDFVKQYFADYCFVSKDVKVKSFEVPYNEVSDHLPLILDFEL